MIEGKEEQWDRFFDLLAQEVAHRLEAQPKGTDAGAEEPAGRDARSDTVAKARVESRPGSSPSALTDASPSAPEYRSEPEAGAAVGTPGPVGVAASEADAASDARSQEASGGQPEAVASPPPSRTARLLGRLALGLLALLVVINIPFNRHGTTLATAMPDRRALVIRDGLVVKEEEKPEIYVYQNGRFRWISSLKAFEMRGYAWDDVHIVKDGFLEPYEIGPPIHVILKCDDSPHIYLLEGEEKRWIVDIEAFEEEGYAWEDVRFVPCSYLRGLPDGETIPPGYGPPPQP